MEEMTGAARLRQAIENQASAGEACFTLPIGEAAAICDECEDELARLSWAQGVSAPVDADGEVVPLTTKVMYDRDGGEHKVNFYSFAPESGYWTVNIDMQSDSETHVTEGFRLRRPDSWELLEKDVERFEDSGTACEYFGNELSDCNECKSPCSIGTNCRNIVARDVLRRAKALAERDVDRAYRD